jgi:tRNA pseudouridine55 synthase
MNNQPPNTNLKPSKLNGIFLINKEAGVTSHDVVFSLRKIIKDKQVGHIGTLDPLADGLLVCLVGESVKLSDYLMGSSKRYRLTFKLGLETDTWDITGKVLNTFEKTVTEDTLRKSILEFTGEQSLPIPMYSAKKVNGQKLYDIARGDETLENFEGPPKEMKFWDLKVISIIGQAATVEFWCSKGSFVRSWIYCLGKKLGIGAVMTELRRLDIGHYSLENALTLDQLRKEMQLVDVSDKKPYFLTPRQALQGYEILQLDANETGKLRSGLVSYALSDRISKLNYQGDLFCFQDTQLVGILNLAEKITVRRVFVNF